MVELNMAWLNQSVAIIAKINTSGVYHRENVHVWSDNVFFIWCIIIFVLCVCVGVRLK